MQINVVPKLANLCEPVRNAMEKAGISHKRCLDACNSHLARLGLAQDKDGNVKPLVAKRGDMKLSTPKKGAAKATITVKLGSVKFQDAITSVSYFIAWHDCIAKANEIAPFDCVEIPVGHMDWLNKFKGEQKPTESATPESATVPQS